MKNYEIIYISYHVVNNIITRSVNFVFRKAKSKSDARKMFNKITCGTPVLLIKIRQHNMKRDLKLINKFRGK